METAELLERQFPIEADHPEIQLRSAADFARQQLEYFRNSLCSGF